MKYLLTPIQLSRTLHYRQTQYWHYFITDNAKLDQTTKHQLETGIASVCD